MKVPMFAACVEASMKKGEIITARKKQE